MDDGGRGCLDASTGPLKNVVWVAHTALKIITNNRRALSSVMMQTWTGPVWFGEIMGQCLKRGGDRPTLPVKSNLNRKGKSLMSTRSDCMIKVKPSGLRFRASDAPSRGNQTRWSIIVKRHVWSIHVARGWGDLRPLLWPAERPVGVDRNEVGRFRNVKLKWW